MNLGNLAKRLAIAGVAIPFVVLCIIRPVMMNIVSISLTFFGTREYLLMRSVMINKLKGVKENPKHPYQIRRVAENTSTGEVKKADDKRSDEFDLPPLFKNSSDMLQIYVRCALATFLPIVGYFYPSTGALAGAALFVALVLFCGTMFGFLHSCCATNDNGALNLEDFVAVCLDMFGMYYVGLGFAFGVSTLITAPYVILCTLFSNWASDAFALFMGKNFGKNKLTPKLSPNKTVEGGIGALLGAVILAATVHQTLIFVPAWQSVLGISNLPSLQKFVLNGLLLGVLGIVGDLVESYMKRVAGVKDSGEFFRAHGGVLDRVDGLLFSFPIMHFMWAFGYF
jgi:CDP-diglyceride synthetase